MSSGTEMVQNQYKRPPVILRRLTISGAGGRIGTGGLHITNTGKVIRYCSAKLGKPCIIMILRFPLRYPGEIMGKNSTEFPQRQHIINIREGVN